MRLGLLGLLTGRQAEVLHIDADVFDGFTVLVQPLVLEQLSADRDLGAFAARIPARVLALFAPDGALQPDGLLLALGEDVDGKGKGRDFVVLARNGAQLGVFTEATDSSDVQHFCSFWFLRSWTTAYCSPVEWPQPCLLRNCQNWA